MNRRTPRIFRNQSGVAAVEFALVLPILCFVLLGIIDGWSFVSHSLSMRAGVKTAANLLMAGAANDTATQAIALSSWDRHPEDAQVTMVREYMCGSTLVDSTSLCAGPKVPMILVRIQATATWVPPFAFGSFLEPRTISHQEVIRVR
ncbi:TadE/TadG family type IV pilus assembly protein [Mesorhizobium amorphae]|uniref:TadE/TadG family type IV pilus assembly protein n=1 Tax=Mesorhizobium amorphae TaxID=71433 RepID=UPI0017877149|nr:TadE/TadG family type IV pilus assembly protein [Mesorhizobium amorphae]